MGRKDKINGVTKEDYFLTINKKDIRDLNVFLKYKGPLVAPIEKGEKVAELIISNKDQQIKKLDIFADDNLKKVNFFKSLITSLNYLIWGDV